MLGKGPPFYWPFGGVISVATHNQLPETTNELLGVSKADAFLFWDPAVGSPNQLLILSLLDSSADVWHSGLALGMGGQPRTIDFVAPTWMLNCDPLADIEAISWRLSLRACLVRTDVLRNLGSPRPEFVTLAGTALEFGHRIICRGAVPRHVPGLVSREFLQEDAAIASEDEFRFILYRYGRKWLYWALLRAVVTRRISAAAALEFRKQFGNIQPPAERESYHILAPKQKETVSQAKVSAIIPTLDRYRYLRVLLGQLRKQTIPAYEIIIADQTPVSERDTTLSDEFADLPVTVLYPEKVGQSTARNLAINRSSGEFLLFLDDDDEIRNDLIERHLVALAQNSADASCGASEEVGALPLNGHFLVRRVSDVFPTNNTMLRRRCLVNSGLFDEAYDKGRNEDHDMGMRLYLSGAKMMYDPDIRVLHHHAPSGGLRANNMRRVTFSSSRLRLMHRNILSVSELFLAIRYYEKRQVRELMLISLLGAFSVRGHIVRRILKVVVSLALLPHTVFKLYRNEGRARAMGKKHPIVLPAISRRKSTRQQLSL